MYDITLRVNNALGLLSDSKVKILKDYCNIDEDASKLILTPAGHDILINKNHTSSDVITILTYIAISVNLTDKERSLFIALYNKSMESITRIDNSINENQFADLMIIWFIVFNQT